MPIEARFTSIELVPPVVPANICEATEEPIAGAIFTLQDRQGKFFKFKHPDFDEFCAKAVKLVGLPYAVVDTDQLIGHWFNLGG